MRSLPSSSAKIVFSFASRPTGRLQIKPSGSGDENGNNLVIRSQSSQSKTLN